MDHDPLKGENKYYMKRSFYFMLLAIVMFWEKEKTPFIYFQF